MPPARKVTVGNLWMEIGLDVVDGHVRVGAGGSGDVSLPARTLGLSVEELCRFGDGVAAAAARREPLDDRSALTAEARRIHALLTGGDIDRTRVRLIEKANGAPVLVRFMIKDPALQSVPWEALCEPEGSLAFWGISPQVLPVRGATAENALWTRAVPHELRVLAVSPNGDGPIELLSLALRDRIASKEVEWLPPIGRDLANADYVVDRLLDKPHVIHFVCHGGVRRGKPSLQLAADPQADGAWMPAALLGQQIASSTKGSVRLVVLEACEGAKPGDFASAAEELARSGVDAVVAHLWPVHTDIARICSERFYLWLAGVKQDTRGNVAAALNEARRRIFMIREQSAEAFSPVLYLRGQDPQIFDFKGSVPSGDVRPGALGTHRAPPPPSPGVPASIDKILRRPFSLVLGDRWKHDQEAIERFRAKLRERLTSRRDPPPPGLPTSALMERAALRLGPGPVQDEFQRIFRNVERPALLDALARVLPVGVHVTLLRTPLLEQAIEHERSDLAINVIQAAGKNEDPTMLRRDPGSASWERVPFVSEALDLDEAILVLRLYRGYTPEQILTPPLLTEDDYLFDSRAIADVLSGRSQGEPTALSEQITSMLDSRPALVMGLSILAWHHRKLLRDLFGDRGLPRGSVAVVDPDEREREMWLTGMGMGGPGQVVEATAEDLTRWLGAVCERKTPVAPPQTVNP